MDSRNTALVTYLNDHLAGSVAALELLERMCAHPSEWTSRWLTSMSAEIRSEQELLRGLIGRFGGSEHTVSKAAAWLGEKLARLKLGPRDGAGGDLMQFEALEALSLGVWGRRALWRALAHAGFEVPGVDLSAMIRRAEQHLEQIEMLRLDAASRALAPAHDPMPAA